MPTDRAAGRESGGPVRVYCSRMSSYWRLTRSPRYSLIFALPLLLLYEALAFVLSHDAITGVRNGADVLLTALLLGGLVRLAAGPAAALDLPTQLMVSLGAGIYEELLFRVLIVGVLAWLARRVLGWGPVAAGVFATVTGALVFSLFHYIGPYGDQLRLASFAFRAIAGVLFSGLYLTRGFGITAWTHALYDVLVTV